MTLRTKLLKPSRRSKISENDLIRIEFSKLSRRMLGRIYLWQDVQQKIDQIIYSSQLQNQSFQDTLIFFISITTTRIPTVKSAKK